MLYYGDLTLAELSKAPYTDMMTDLYYCVCFVLRLKITPLEEPRHINAGHNR